jgi:hypothetical protein
MESVEEETSYRIELGFTNSDIASGVEQCCVPGMLKRRHDLVIATGRKIDDKKPVA